MQCPSHPCLVFYSQHLLPTLKSCGMFAYWNFEKYIYMHDFPCFFKQRSVCSVNFWNRCEICLFRYDVYSITDEKQKNMMMQSCYDANMEKSAWMASRTLFTSAHRFYELAPNTPCAYCIVVCERISCWRALRCKTTTTPGIPHL